MSRTHQTDTKEFESFRKKFRQMDVIDDFLFAAILSQPDFRTPFCRILLRTILGQDFSDIDIPEIVPQKIITGADTDMHGIRMDAYIKISPDGSDSRATIYNMEMETRTANRRELPRRNRFYSASIDTQEHPGKATYDKLHDLITILILSYDPFGQGDLYYESRSCLITHPGVPYEDGIRRIFLYTEGRLNTDALSSLFRPSARDGAATPYSPANDGKKLQDMLRYIRHSIRENVKNSDIAEVHHMVEQVKERKSAIVISFTPWRIMQDALSDGREQGLAKGREEGREEGLAAGREEGLAAGREEALAEAALAHIRSVRKYNASDDAILQDLVEHFHITPARASELMTMEAKP